MSSCRKRSPQEEAQFQYQNGPEGCRLGSPEAAAWYSQISQLRERKGARVNAVTRLPRGPESQNWAARNNPHQRRCWGPDATVGPRPRPQATSPWAPAGPGRRPRFAPFHGESVEIGRPTRDDESEPRGSKIFGETRPDDLGNVEQGGPADANTSQLRSVSSGWTVGSECPLDLARRHGLIRSERHDRSAPYVSQLYP